MPPLNTAAGDLLIVEPRATANTIERSECPGRMVTVGAGQMRGVAEGH